MGPVVVDIAGVAEVVVVVGEAEDGAFLDEGRTFPPAEVAEEEAVGADDEGGAIISGVVRFEAINA